MSESHEGPRQEEKDRAVPGEGGGSKKNDSYPEDNKEHVTPGPGGYDGRDPATEMPRVPSAPETQDQ